MMDPQARQRSLLLEDAGRSIAQWTIDEHERQDESLPHRYGGTWRSSWANDIQQRIQYLAQAVAVESSTLFIDFARWTQASYLSRNVPVDDFRTSLDCMQGVIDESLPPVVAAPALEYIRAALDHLEEDPTVEHGLNGSAQVDHERLNKLLEAALAGRGREAESLITELMDQGQSINEIFVNLLQPFMVEVGRRWHGNEITVADEHAATAVIGSAMAVLRSRCPVAELNGNRLVATSIAGELHAMGLRMVADLFEMDGWSVFYLGPDTPHEDIVQSLRNHDAHLLAVSVTSLLNLRALGDLIQIIKGQDDLSHIKILVGGRPLQNDPSIWQRLGADACAATAEEAVRLGHQLVDDA